MCEGVRVCVRVSEWVGVCVCVRAFVWMCVYVSVFVFTDIYGLKGNPELLFSSHRCAG